MKHVQTFSMKSGTVFIAALIFLSFLSYVLLLARLQSETLGNDEKEDYYLEFEADNYKNIREALELN